MNIRKLVVPVFAIITLAAASGVQAQKTERISATAMGTGTQLGRIVNIDITINEYSNEQDKAGLLEAFQANGSEGLANALDKMKAKGRIAITGTLGYDLNYIRSFNMPDGSRLIRFATDRPIRFGEAWASSRTMDYQLSIGEILIAKEKGKTKGTIVPVARVKLNKERDVEIEAYQNPWDLNNVRIWK